MSEKPKCPVCGQEMMNVRLFSQQWSECSVSVMLALAPIESLLGDNAEIDEALKKHEEDDRRSA